MDNYYAIDAAKKYLASTPEFAKLKSAIFVLKKNPKASALVQQFQKKEESVYSSYNSGVNQPMHSQPNSPFNELTNDYEKLMTIPEINNYFTASESFNMLLNNYMRELNQSLQHELY